MEDWESAIDQQIREAMERGDFDDLPGKGKPLEWTSNPWAGDKEMAFKVLKDSGFAPEWIELDKGIRTRLDRARQVAARRWAWHRDQLAELDKRSDAQVGAERKRSAATWEKALEDFVAEVATINREIGELNLKVPDSNLQRSRIDAERELARIKAE